MKRIKKISAVAAALTLILSVCVLAAGCSNQNQTYSVGICQLTQHEALDAATEGFVKALENELGKENVTIDIQNASGDSNVCSTIVNSFVNHKVDLIMANSTPALQAACNATGSIPILGTSVTEYGVALGLTDYNGTVGGNVSGTSDLAPLDEIAAMITELVPDAKKVGMLYCSAEPNSEYQVAKVEKILKSQGIEVTRCSFADGNDVASVVSSACAGCDALYIPTDNTAASCAATIGNIVKEKKIPVIAGDEGTCKQCGIASLSISYYDLGYKTGQMAAMILKGEADISDMPIEYAAAEKKYNPEICDLLGIEVPEEYKALS